MKKVLLINPAHENEDDLDKHTSHRAIHRDPPPIGALYIGTYLFHHGYQVDIIDTHIEENYIDVIDNYISNNNYIFVGMTVIIGKFLRNAAELTNHIKDKFPQLTIVWGGIMASIMSEEVLNEYAPDIVVRYEGEETALELAETLYHQKKLDHVKGISYLDETQNIIHNKDRIPKTQLDDYPIPNWKLLGSHFNIKQIPYYYLIMSSRGCPFNCSFCYKHSIDKSVRKTIPPWRYRTSKHIIEEIEYIHKHTGTAVFTFGDDNFFVNKKRALEVLTYFQKNNFYIEECIGHLNCLDDDIIDAMGGIVQTFIFSVETASHRLQKYINKNLLLEDVPIKVEKLYRKGIVSPVSFLIGLPTENKNDLRKNVELMMTLKKINPFVRGNVYLFFPLPYTKLTNQIKIECNVKITNDIRNYEKANFWVRDTNDQIGKKFRPWISDKQFKTLVLYGYVFNDVFKACNIEIENKIKTILKEDSDIRELFDGIESVNHPNAHYRPYILDRVLNGESINLLTDLKYK